MNALLALAALPGASSIVGLIVWVAIACVAVWAITALVKSTGWNIPQPVWIVLTALVAIFLILLIAKFFGLLL